MLALELGHQGVDDGLDVAGVRRVRAALLRGAHTDEVDVGEGGGFGVARRKAQAPCLDVALEYLGKARLVERHFGVLQRLDLGFVNVYAQHLVAEFSHARRVRRPEVTSTNHSHPHRRRVAPSRCRNYLQVDGLMPKSSRLGRCDAL